jgi:prophage regulatory protein
MMKSTATPDRIVSVRELMDRSGLSRPTIYRRVKVGDIPLPRQISPGRVGWLESEVQAWLANLATPIAYRSVPTPMATASKE